MARTSGRLVLAWSVIACLACGTSSFLHAQDFRRGDANDDGMVIPIADAQTTLNGLFQGGSIPCFDAWDVNDDGAVNIADTIFLLSWGFIPGGPPPASPGPDVCGPDATADSIDCATYTSCAPPAPLVPDPDFVLTAGSAIGSAGDSVEIPVTLDNAEELAGWAIGLCHSSANVQLTGVVEGATTETVGPGGNTPDFSHIEESTDGWYAGVLVAFLGQATLPVGDDQELYRATYTLLTGTSSLEFCETLGTPPVGVHVVLTSGDPAKPVTELGTLTAMGMGTPANDDCANAIPTNGGQVPFVLVGATTDGPDLAGQCDPGPAGDDIVHQDVWFCYSARFSGIATVDTSGSGLDTRLAVYFGCSCPADPINVITCDDDALGGAGESQVSWEVVAGESYLIQVGTAAAGTPTGTGILSIDVDPLTPPVNDDCGDAAAIGAGVTIFSLDNATTDGPDLAGFCDPGPSGDDIVHQDVWFIYNASCQGDVTITTDGSGLDTRLAVYSSTDCPVDASTVVACDDDALGFPPGESSVTFAANAGDSFLVQVGTFSESTSTGSGQLTVLCDGIVISFDFRRGDANGDGALDVGDTIYLLNFQFQGGPGVECADAGDANDDGVINIADAITLLNYLFNGGPLPSPGPRNCGPDVTDDILDCAIYDGC